MSLTLADLSDALEPTLYLSRLTALQISEITSKSSNVIATLAKSAAPNKTVWLPELRTFVMTAIAAQITALSADDLLSLLSLPKVQNI